MLCSFLAFIRIVCHLWWIYIGLLGRKKMWFFFTSMCNFFTSTNYIFGGKNQNIFCQIRELGCLWALQRLSGSSGCLRVCQRRKSGSSCCLRVCQRKKLGSSCCLWVCQRRSSFSGCLWVCQRLFWPFVGVSKEESRLFSLFVGVSKEEIRLFLLFVGVSYEV